MFASKAPVPIATLLSAVVLFPNALVPTAILALPVVLASKAPEPKTTYGQRNALGGRFVYSYGE